MRAAALRGHGPAMANLGLLYVNGRGVPQDFVLGYMWLTLADAAGLPGAAALAGRTAARMTPGQIEEAQIRAQAQWETVRK